MPKQARGEETAARLLDAALAVYAKAGHAGFTVHAVSAASGVSLGSLYHHFKSREGLAAALYSRCMGELLDGILASLEEAPRTARAGVAALVRAYLAFVGTYPDKARFIYEAAYAGFTPAEVASITAEKAPRLAKLLAWTRPYVRDGSVVDLPEPLLEMLIIGPVAEVSRRWIAGVPGIDLEEAARLLPKRIWRSLCRSPR